MTQSPAGWYPEPDPNHVGPPGRLRYWDGTRWTEHVHDPEAQPPPPAGPPAHPDPSGPSQGGFAPIGGTQPEYPSSPPAYPSYPTGQEQYGQAPYGQPYAAASYGNEPTTPDGERLAGWWQRVLAAILDFFIQIPLIVAASIPVIASQWGEITDWFDDLTDAVEANGAAPPEPAIFDVSTGPGIALVLSGAIASLLYSVVFLAWKQATPGKLVVGLRVRRRESPDLPGGTIAARVGFVSLIGIGTQVIPILFVISLLDVLWPLWDSKKQALHDKVAGTNVVRTR